MALTVETGTGSATANSFVTDAEFVAWLTARGRKSAVQAVAPSGSTREPYLVLAFDYLRNEERFKYRGTRATATQAAPWPRVGAAERDGPVIPSDVIPWRLKDAQCAAAYQMASSGDALQPPLEAGGRIASETVGPISTSYFDSGPGGAVAETIYPEVAGLLSPLLWDVRTMPLRAVPYVTEPVTVVGFNNEFAPPDPSTVVEE